VDLLEESKIHNTFHVSLLKKRVNKGQIPDPKLSAFEWKEKNKKEPS